MKKRSRFDLAVPSCFTSSRTAREGWEAARRIQPCLILLDIVVPSLDGLAVLGALKEAEATKHIPVIVLSEHGEDTYVINANRGHTNAYVSKGHDFPALCAIVKSINGFWLGAVVPPSRDRRKQTP